MTYGAAVFQSRESFYHADSCQPLKAAAERGELQLEALSHEPYPGRVLPAGDLGEVRSVGVWDAPVSQSWGLDWHRNEGVELTYVSHGNVAFAADEQKYLLKHGHLTVTRPWQLHRVGDPKLDACKLTWLILDVGVRQPHQTWRWPPWFVLSAENLARLTQLLQHNEQPVWPTDAAVRQGFEALERAVRAQGAATQETRLKLAVNALFLALLELLETKQLALDESLTSSRRSVELFLKTLPGCLEHPWTLEAMANACGLARSQFSGHCKDLTNLTPVDYLTQCRVDAATVLLSGQPHLRITDVALSCGFGSSQYFATVFRKYTGRTPTAFRLQDAVTAP